MGLSRNLKRIGMAAYNEKRDTRDLIEYQTRMDAKRKEAADVEEETKLILEMNEKYGDAFADWYDSPAVPDHGYARDRIKLIQEWEKQQQAPTFLEGMTAPVVGYVRDNAIRWNTDETPATYRAVWNDDSPDSVTFEKINRPA